MRVSTIKEITATKDEITNFVTSIWSHAHRSDPVQCRHGLKLEGGLRLMMMTTKSVMAMDFRTFHRSYAVILVVLFVTVPLLLFTPRSSHFLHLYNKTFSRFNSKVTFSRPTKVLLSSCQNCLTEMVKGTWTPRTVTEHEKYRVERFLKRARGKYFIPTNLARPDGICGNTTFEFLRGLQHQALWFRPLCDPEGATPCCYNNRCVYKTIEECKCENCYDMRTPLNAELAEWTPSNRDCQIKEFTTDDACHLLKGAHVYYIGDSFLRQLYTVTVNLLTGNYVDSALKPDTPTGWKKYCSNWIQLLCYTYINYRAPVCSGDTHIEHVELLTHNQGPALLKLLKQTRNITRRIFFVGIGIHGTYNEANVWKSFLLPSITYLHANAKLNISWPRLVWVAPHAPGIMKTPRVPGQSYSSVVRYNAYINDKLKKANIPILDTFNMTEGIMSFDGAHYGFGINKIKSQILLNYLNELVSSGSW